jgi:hypothetical protein
MANIQITQLPAGGPITGTEQVPVVQNGVTVRVPTSAIAASPAQQQTFLTLNQETTLPNSRALSGSLGVGLTDGGALSTLTITLNGASGSLEAASNGLVAKTGASTVTNRSIAVSGSGLSVTNGSGASGDPTLALSGLPASLAGLSGTGILNMINSTSVGTITILGTSNQIDVANGNGVGNPTISITSNPILPGTGGATMPSGGTAARPAVPVNGTIRYNTDFGLFEAYLNGSWFTLASGSGVTSILTGNGLQGGPITSTGTISINTAITATLADTQTFTNKTISGASNTVSVTNGLTIGTGLTGTSYDGSAPVTIAIDSTVVTTTGNQTLTNKTINGSNNTLTNVPNSALVNSAVTVGTTSISLGASSLTLGGLTSVAVTQDPTTALQLATKQYVDAVAQGLNVHAACDAATTGTLASITGGTVTYNNGTSGVGATLTLSVALTVLDGYTILNGNRILVKDQASQLQNGIYTWATGGTVLTRATDFDTNVEIANGDFTFVTYGTQYGNTGWVQTLPVTTVGTSPISWSQFSGTGTYSAGNGLTLTGTVFSLTAPVSIANGGTNATSASTAFNNLSPITSTGDLILGNGANSATRLGIGTSGYVLKSTGSTAAWQVNPTFLPITLHSGTQTDIPIGNGFLPVLLHDGVTTVNVTCF